MATDGPSPSSRRPRSTTSRIGVGPSASSGVFWDRRAGRRTVGRVDHVVGGRRGGRNPHTEIRVFHRPLDGGGAGPVLPPPGGRLPPAPGAGVALRPKGQGGGG